MWLFTWLSDGLRVREIATLTVVCRKVKTFDSKDTSNGGRINGGWKECKICTFFSAEIFSKNLKTPFFGIQSVLLY